MQGEVDRVALLARTTPSISLHQSLAIDFYKFVINYNR